MRWLRLVWSRGRVPYAFAVLFAITAGVTTTGLVAVVRRAAATPTLAWDLGPRFVALALLLVGCIVLSRNLCGYVNQTLVLPELRQSTVESFVAAPSAHSDRLRGGPFLGAITEGTMRIGFTVEVSLWAVRSIVTVVALLGYLAWLDARLFVIAAAALALSLVVVVAQRRLVRAESREAARLQDAVASHVQTLVAGIRELKLSAARQDTFLRAYAEDARALHRRLYRVAASSSFSTAWASVIFLAVIGVVLLAPGLMSARADAVAGYVLALIYLQSELQVLLIALPMMAGADAALEAIERVRAPAEAQGFETLPTAKGSSSQEIQLENVAFEYPGPDGKATFTFGPLNFQLRGGEVVFLVGGNGSGKSTLARLLATLYAADKGTVRLAGEAVGPDRRGTYREQFSAVLADWHVFPRLYGMDPKNAATSARAHLERVQLADKVAVAETDGAFSTLALSQGQLKRLALVTALLEDRPFYVFDEWASDQDPEYKRAFYEEIVPALKARGKAVLVITHDDRYFSRADRVVKLDCGRIVDVPQTG